MNEVQKLRDLLTKYTARTAVGLEKQRLFTRDMLGFFSDQDLKHLEDLINKERAERKMEDEDKRYCEVCDIQFPEDEPCRLH